MSCFANATSIFLKSLSVNSRSVDITDAFIFLSAVNSSFFSDLYFALFSNFCAFFCCFVKTFFFCETLSVSRSLLSASQVFCALLFSLRDNVEVSSSFSLMEDLAVSSESAVDSFSLISSSLFSLTSTHSSSSYI